MKLAALFSGGKDSTLALAHVREQGHQVVCLLSIYSENEESYMFHTPAIRCVEQQAQVLGLPLLKHGTKGEKEEELLDLKTAILDAKNRYEIEGIVTGAVASTYQASRIQNLCDDLGLLCLNPLWGRDQFSLLDELLERNFTVILTGVFAAPLTKEWVGRQLDEKMIQELRLLEEKYKINPAGEGGEFESLVLDCRLFERPLKIKSMSVTGEGHSWRGEVILEDYREE